MERLTETELEGKYGEVCRELNLDEEAQTAAWDSYQTINNDYVLEGPQIEWLACALYVACRSSTTHTIDGSEYSGNSISLTQILRVTKLKLIEFFRKIKKWLEMAKLPQIYLEKVEALERKFEVISVIFKKYEVEFAAVFLVQNDASSGSGGSGNTGRARGRKPNKARPCNSMQLFQFGWVLYIYIKNQFPLISDDLVNSHYLLLCCLEMLCSTVFSCQRRDLLNPEFVMLSNDSNDSASLPSAEFPNILPELCKKFAAIEKECRVVRDYYWWPSVKKLYESGVLVGPGTSPELADVLGTLLSPQFFQANLRSLKTTYELMMLSEGDFDERLFFNSQSELDHDITNSNPSQQPDSEEAVKLQPGIIYQSPQHLQYGTPLTGREYMPKEAKLTPVSDANQSVLQLHLLLEDCGPEPSESLVKICSCCPTDPLKEIKIHLETMSKTFLSSFKAGCHDSPDNFALLRLQLSQSLYYRLLGAIALDEESKTTLNPQIKYATLQNMLEHSLFHKSLFALCIEIVLFSYNSHSKIFPWVLSIIGIKPYHFYKVIEVVIKVESGFPRGVVKHLSKIEESILSSLAWESVSPLYDSIEGSIPYYRDVALPISSPMSPLHRLKTSRDNCSSPLSAKERYNSPIPVSSTSRRQLFGSKTSPTKIPGSPVKPIAPKPPQGKVQVTPLTQAAALLSLIKQQSTSLNKPKSDSAQSPPTNISPLVNLMSPGGTEGSGVSVQALVSLANMTSPLKTSPEKPGGHVTSAPPPPVPSITVTCSSSPTQTDNICTTPTSGGGKMASPPKPKCNGSIALFYRKVFQMSYLRMKDLCERLQLDNEVLQKVWTCFEFSLKRSPHVMRDRHIDQLIMCAIYVVAKVLRKDVTFQEIMRQYRHQPQAKSHIYRSVLLNSGLYSPPKKMDITPQKPSDDPLHKDQEEVEKLLYRDDILVGSRGDIIQFYNKVYINYVKDFVLKLSPDENSSIPLSPLPVIRRNPISPRKLSRNHQIFISPLKSNLGNNQSSLSPLAKTYVVNKSPATDLHELNSVVSGASSGNKVGGAKRQLVALLSNSPVPSSPAKRQHLEQARMTIQQLSQTRTLPTHTDRSRLTNGTSARTTIPLATPLTSSTSAPPINK